MTGTPAAALFLDRDGVINEEAGYLYRREDVRWVEGIFDLVRSARHLGLKVVVVTNQSGIARGLYTTEEFLDLMQWMRGCFWSKGAELDGIYHCPYHPIHGIGKWKREHMDRKPGPGMLLRAARDLDLDLRRSVLVGDRCSDMGAAQAAGLQKAFLMHGTETGPCSGAVTPVTSLADVQQWLEHTYA